MDIISEYNSDSSEDLSILEPKKCYVPTLTLIIPDEMSDPVELIPDGSIKKRAPHYTPETIPFDFDTPEINAPATIPIELEKPEINAPATIPIESEKQDTDEITPSELITQELLSSSESKNTKKCNPTFCIIM
jgi:hypothetical protein